MNPNNIKNNVLIILNKKNCKYSLEQFKEYLINGDQLKSIKAGGGSLHSKLFNAINKSNCKYILFLNSSNKDIVLSEMMALVRTKIDSNTKHIMLFDNTSELTDDSSLLFTKHDFNKVEITNTASIKALFGFVLKENYIDKYTYGLMKVKKHKKAKDQIEQKNLEPRTNIGSKFYEQTTNVVQERIKNIFGLKEKKPKKKFEIESSEPASYTIIIPFMYNGDRDQIFYFCAETLLKLCSKYNNINVCIHEVGPRKTLKESFLAQHKVHYTFTKKESVFSRGWALNAGVRFFERQNLLNNYVVLFDGDILVDQNWIEELLNFKGDFAFAWDNIKYFSREATWYTLDTGITKFDEIRDILKTVTPSKDGAAGGITVVRKDIFFKVKGLPEFFQNTWGGNDNVFAYKVDIFGYKLDEFSTGALHLYHNHTQARQDHIRSKFQEVKAWDIERWQRELEHIGDQWGIRSNICIAMISWRREQKLIKTLKNIREKTKIPLSIVLQIQGTENIDKELKVDILKALEGYTVEKVFWNEGNYGTALPRYNTTQFAYDLGYEYVLIIDSDMLINEGTIEKLIETIEANPEFDAIGCWCLPNYFQHAIVNGQHHSVCIEKPGLYKTDVLGTGCVIVRAKVFEKCHFDKYLKIGFVDYAWCLELRNYGYKIAILADSNHRIINNSLGQNEEKEYYKERYNFFEIEKSRQYIKEKYGILF